MKNLSEKEFGERVVAVSKARKIFIPGMVKNISTAFMLYQEILAEKKSPKQITQKAPIARPNAYTEEKHEMALTDIQCPECKAKMYKESICPKCVDGKKGFKIRLMCEENPDHEVLL